MKILLKKNGVLIFLLLFLQSVVGLYSYNLLEVFQKKETTTYHLEEDQYSIKSLSSAESDKFQIRFNFRNIINSLVSIDLDDETEGYVKYSITDSKNQTILTGKSTVEEILPVNGILINLPTEIIDNEQPYSFLIESQLNKPLSLRISQSGFVDTIETYPFEWYEIIRKGVIIGNIIFLICLIALVSRIKSEYKFLLLSLLIGGIASFVIVPASGPDEWRHFLRAYDLAQTNDHEYEVVEIFEGTQEAVALCLPQEYGDIKDLGTDKNKNWTDEMNNSISIPKLRTLFEENELTGEKASYPMLATSEFSLLHYLPQVIFIKIANIFEMKPIWVFYMARWGNVIFTSLLAFWAIRLTPKYKNIMIGLFFIPGLTLLRGICSTDGLLFSLVLLLVAYTIYLRENNINILSWRVCVGYILLGTYITLLKLPYVLLLALICLVNNASLKSFTKKGIVQSEKHKWIIKVSYTSVMVFLSLVISNIILTTSRIALIPQSSAINIRAIEYFFENPLHVISLLVRTFADTFAGEISEAFMWPLNGGIWFIYLLVLIWICWCEDGIRLKFHEKGFLLGLAFVIWSGILVVFYMLSTIGGDTIWGMQGRYMIPLMLLIAMCLSDIGKRDLIAIQKYMPILIMSCNAVFYIMLVSRFWCNS